MKRYKFYRHNLIIVLFIIILSFFSTQSIFPQEKEVTRGRNIFFFEIGGNAVKYSINYERLILNFLSVRIGYADYNISFIDTDLDAIKIYPIMFVFLLNRNENSYLELGGGLLLGDVKKVPFIWKKDNIYKFIFISDKKIITDSNPVYTFSLGYRYQPFTKGPFFHSNVVFFKTNQISYTIGLGIGICI